MAYQTGVPASTASLIDTYINWIVAQCGFTLGNTWTYTGNTGDGESGSPTTNWTARALFRDSQYAYLSWYTTSPDRIVMNVGTNNPTTSRLDLQTDSDPNNWLVILGTAPLRYWMFADGYSAHCVIEWIGGAFQHISVGYVEKYGSWTGGVYVSGVYNEVYTDGSSIGYTNGSTNSSPPFGCMTPNNNGILRITYASGTVRRLYSYTSTSMTITCGMLHGFGLIHRSSPNSYNGRAVITPIELAYREPLSGYQIRPIGRVSNCGLINIANINPTDTILTDWMAFPWSAKNSGGGVGSGYVNSENYGIAYKK